MTLCELLHLARKGYQLTITDKYIRITDKRTNEEVLVFDVIHDSMSKLERWRDEHV